MAAQIVILVCQKYMGAGLLYLCLERYIQGHRPDKGKFQLILFVLARSNVDFPFIRSVFLW